MNLEANTVGDVPQVDETAYVHRRAMVIGNIRIGPKVYIRLAKAKREERSGEVVKRSD